MREPTWRQRAPSNKCVRTLRRPHRKLTDAGPWSTFPAVRVLVVEDQKKIARALHTALERAGMNVVSVHDGEDGLTLAMNEAFDAVVLDLMLPRRDGLDVLRELRSQHRTTPVLLLSARGEVEDRIRGLEFGADDYLPKPFVLAEVVARVRALGRRGVPRDATYRQVADMSLDLLQRNARRGGRRLALTEREFRLLAHLAQAEGRVCSRAELYEHVWDYRPGFDAGPAVIQMAIRRLREKVDADFPVKLIQTVFSEGYALRAEP